MLAVREKTQLMSASEIDRHLGTAGTRTPRKTEELDKLALLGIRRRGVPLAQRLVAR